jgi:hypothetical protein
MLYQYAFFQLLGIKHDKAGCRKIVGQEVRQFFQSLVVGYMSFPGGNNNKQIVIFYFAAENQEIVPVAECGK